MSKYDPLFKHLSGSSGALELQFTEVEEILGFELPASARRYTAWWSNSGGSHVQSSAWLAAGYRTADVDIDGMTLKFVPQRSAKGFGEMKQANFDPMQMPGDQKVKATVKESAPHPLFGIWKGKVTLLPDYDYTQPADPEWAKVYDD